MDDIINISCSVYYNAINVLPALVQSWCGDQEKKTSSLVDRWVAGACSSLLVVASRKRILSRYHCLGGDLVLE
jgi:phage gp37-like protein